MLSDHICKFKHECIEKKRRKGVYFASIENETLQIIKMQCGNLFEFHCEDFVLQILFLKL